MLAHFAYNTEAINRRGEFHRLFTSPFLHLDAVHLASNLSALRDLCAAWTPVYGTVSLLTVYAASAVFGAAAEHCIYTARGVDVTSVGASGAIYGVMGAVAANNRKWQQQQQQRRRSTEAAHGGWRHLLRSRSDARGRTRNDQLGYIDAPWLSSGGAVSFGDLSSQRNVNVLGHACGFGAGHVAFRLLLVHNCIRRSQLRRQRQQQRARTARQRLPIPG